MQLHAQLQPWKFITKPVEELGGFQIRSATPGSIVHESPIPTLVSSTHPLLWFIQLSLRVAKHWTSFPTAYDFPNKGVWLGFMHVRVLSTLLVHQCRLTSEERSWKQENLVAELKSPAIEMQLNYSNWVRFSLMLTSPFTFLPVRDASLELFPVLSHSTLHSLSSCVVFPSS